MQMPPINSMSKRQHGREDRPPDEEIDHVGSYLAFLPAGDVSGCGFVRRVRRLFDRRLGLG